MEFRQRSNGHIREELGDRVRKVRKGKGLSQTELAERAGLSRPTVSTFERGNDVSVDSFLSILRALDLLEALSLVVPEPGVSPIAALTGNTQPGRPARKGPKPTWIWGDENPEPS